MFDFIYHIVNKIFEALERSAVSTYQSLKIVGSSRDSDDQTLQRLRFSGKVLKSKVNSRVRQFQVKFFVCTIGFEGELYRISIVSYYCKQ